MIPIRDENPTLHTSLATFGIILINILAWIFVQKLGTEPSLTKSIFTNGLIPGELLQTIPAGTSFPIGESYSYVIEARPNYWSIITSMFMHGGWLHIIGNLWFLFVFGDNVEDAMGSFKFLIFYLLCGVAAAITQMFSNPQSHIPMVGASGAIGGVMGAYAVLYPRARIHLLIFLGFYINKIVVPAFFVLLYWFMLQFIGLIPSLGRGGGVAFFAHIGGFIAGIILVFIFRNKRRMKKRNGI